MDHLVVMIALYLVGLWYCWMMAMILSDGPEESRWLSRRFFWYSWIWPVAAAWIGLKALLVRVDVLGRTNEDT